MTGSTEPLAQAPMVNFIRDEPANDDFFDTHTRLASSIMRTIEHHPDMKVIGLLGRWGSGKSTVAKKIVDFIDNAPDGKFRIFTYDAWLHQAEPVRRSFLESLLRHLVDVDALQKAKWNRKLQELNGQVENTETIEAPTLSTAGHWLVFSLFAVPIGVGLLGLDTIKEAFGSQSSALGFWTLFLALTLITLPAIVWAVRYLWQRPWNIAFRWGSFGITSPIFWSSMDEDGSPTAALRLFANREVKRTNTRTLRSGEPSSIEFGRVFQEIMQEANANGRRLVILIDNLDRIGNEDAVKMWGTIRSFFLAEHETEDSRYESFHPTVILPIDRFAIEQMFAAEDQTSDNNRDRAGSFIDKTFDVTFEVTEPVGSDWRAFLEKQMRYVFGEAHRPQWAFWTRRLFERELPETDAIVTPREINKLINRIGALYMQWHGEGIAVEVMALYVIQRPKIERGLLHFFQSFDPNFDHAEPDWQRQLAALHYGVPLAKAAQVVLEEPLRNAIETFDRVKFAELAAIPGFGEIFEFVSADLPEPPASPSAREFIVIGNAALLLESIARPSGEWKEAAWRNLVGRYIASSGADYASEDLRERIKCIAAHTPPSRLAAFVSATAKGLSGLLALPRPQLNTVITVAASNLVELAVQHDIELPLFPLAIDPKQFVLRMGALSNSPQVWPRLRTSHEHAELGEALTSAIQTKGEQLSAANAARCLVTSEGEQIYGGDGLIDWEGLSGTAANIARHPTNHDIAPIPAIRMLAGLVRIDEARNHLVQLIEEGVIAAKLVEARDAKSPANLGFLTAIMLWRNERFDAPNDVRWTQISASHPSFAGEVVGALRRYFPDDIVGILWGAHAKCSWPTTDMIEEVIGNLVESGDLGSFDKADLFLNLPRYKSAVPWRLRDRFLELVEGEADFISELQSTPFGPQILEAVDFLDKRGGAEAERAHEILRQRVVLADAESWQSAILNGHEPYKMALKVRESGEQLFSRRTSLVDAMSFLIPHMATSASKDTRIRWFEMEGLLKSQARKAVLRRLAASLDRSSPDQILALLRAGGLRFLKYGGFASEPDQSLSSVVLSQLQKKEGRDWLKDNSAEVQGWITGANNSSREAVRQALLGLRNSRLEERRYSAELLMGQWKLNTT